jgi:hypothetical protein
MNWSVRAIQVRVPGSGRGGVGVSVVEGVTSLVAFDLEFEALADAHVRDFDGDPGGGLHPEEVTSIPSFAR